MTVDIINHFDEQQKCNTNFIYNAKVSSFTLRRYKQLQLQE